jgi:hypothetical protein
LLARHPEDYETFIAVAKAVAREWATPQSGEFPRPPLPFHVCLVVARQRAGTRAAWGVPRLSIARSPG